MTTVTFARIDTSRFEYAGLALTLNEFDTYEFEVRALDDRGRPDGHIIIDVSPEAIWDLLSVWTGLDPDERSFPPDNLWKLNEDDFLESLEDAYPHGMVAIVVNGVVVGWDEPMASEIA